MFSDGETNTGDDSTWREHPLTLREFERTFGERNYVPGHDSLQRGFGEVSGQGFGDFRDGYSDGFAGSSGDGHRSNGQGYDTGNGFGREFERTLDERNYVPGHESLQSGFDDGYTDGFVDSYPVSYPDGDGFGYDRPRYDQGTTYDERAAFQAQPPVGFEDVELFDPRQPPQRSRPQLGSDFSSYQDGGSVPSEPASAIPSTPMGMKGHSTARSDWPSAFRKSASLESIRGTKSWQSAAAFPWCTAYCPVTFASVVILLSTIIVVSFWPGWELDTDFGSFLIVDGSAAAHQEALDDASSLTGVSDTSTTSSEASAVYDQYDVRLIYKDITGAGMLTSGLLREVLSLETELKAGSSWQQLCKATGDYEPACSPGFSIVNALWFDWNGQDLALSTTQYPEVKINGEGDEAMNMNAALALLESRGVLEWLLPKTYEDGVDPTYSSSVFRFYLKRGLMTDSEEVLSAQTAINDETYRAFVDEELYPALTELKKNIEESSGSLFEFYWTGDLLHEYAVYEALASDIRMAVGSAVVILLYLTYHTRSPITSLVSVALIFAAMPASFFTLYILSGSKIIGGACFLAFFLIVGLGAEMALVFSTTWMRSKSLEARDASRATRRIKYLLKNAGAASMATSVTTACSFLANLVSALRPLREFGCFMGLCVMWTYFLFLCILPAVLQYSEWIEDQILPFRYHPPPEAVRGHRSKTRDSLGGTADAERTLFSTGGLAVMLIKKFVDKFLLQYRRSLAACFFIIPIGLAVWTGFSAEGTTGNPDMFPEDHNEYSAPSLADLFNDGNPADIDVQTTICYVGAEWPSDSQLPDCGLHWCALESFDTEPRLYGTAAETDDDDTVCQCKPSSYPSSMCTETTSSSEDISVHTRIVGFNDIAATFWTSSAWYKHLQAVVQMHNPSATEMGDPHTNTSMVSLARLMQMDWESGISNVEPNLFAPVSYIPTSGLTGTYCPVAEVCYCYTPACQLWEQEEGVTIDEAYWTTLSIPTSLTESRRLRESSEGQQHQHQHQQQELQMRPTGLVLTEPSSNSYLRTRSADWNPGSWSGLEPWAPRQLTTFYDTVHIVWGIEVDQEWPLLGKRVNFWSFDDSFRPEAPTVQRFWLDLCEEIEDKEGLMVVKRHCWIEYFKDWLEDQGEVFPCRSSIFSTSLDTFAREVFMNNGASVQDSMWFNVKGDLRAASLQFSIQITGNSASDVKATRKVMLKWDDYLTDLNMKAPLGANTGFHASELWITAEAQSAVVRSLVISLILAATFTLIGASVATSFDVALGAAALISVLAMTICVAWCMAVLFSWAVGAIEVLGIIVFMGYSLTFVLHGAIKYREGVRVVTMDPHKTCEDKRRYGVRCILIAIAGPTLGSALMTVGSSLFLFFCTIQIFVKVAIILLVVTLFAGSYALIGFPALLALIGPTVSYSLRTLWNQVYDRLGLDRFKITASGSELPNIETGSMLSAVPQQADPSPSTSLPAQEPRDAAPGSIVSPSETMENGANTPQDTKLITPVVGRQQLEPPVLR